MKDTFKKTVTGLILWAFILAIGYYIATTSATNFAKANWRNGAYAANKVPHPNHNQAFSPGPVRAAATMLVDSTATAAKLTPLIGPIDVTFNPSRDDVKVTGAVIGGSAGGRFTVQFIKAVPEAGSPDPTEAPPPELQLCGSLQQLDWIDVEEKSYPIREDDDELGDDVLLVRWEPGKARPDHDYRIRFVVSPPSGQHRLVQRYIKRSLKSGEVVDFQLPSQLQTGGTAEPLMTDLHVAVCFSDGQTIPSDQLELDSLPLSFSDTLGGTFLHQPYKGITGLTAARLQLGNKLPRPIDVLVTTVTYPR